MSLNSLAANRVARDVASAKGVTTLSAASDDSLGMKGEDVQNALSALVEYLPAETITLYLAVLAALPVLVKSIPGLRASAIYWVFASLTPVLFALIYMGKRRAAGQSRLPERPGNWPWWPTIASLIAFLTWGIAVPEGPFFTDESGRVIAGLIAIVVSTFLGVGGRFFAPKPE